MGCLILVAALASPRLALAIVWIFTSAVDQAYESAWIPVLGFVLFPWATLAYAIAFGPFGVSPLGWVFVACALLADLGSYAGGSRTRRLGSEY